MRARIVPLSHLVPSISWWSVWNLPHYVWTGYAGYVDAWLANQQKTK